jgi:type I restriction enzyme S subunit
LKWAVTFQRGYDLPTEDRQQGPIPVVTGGGIAGWHNVAQAKGPGIVTGRYGTIGEFYLVEQDYWPLNTSLYSIDLHGNHVGFLHYMLEPLAPLFHLNAAKSAVPGIDRSDIHTIPVAVPPLTTQCAIANYLDRETERLDALMAAKERLSICWLRSTGRSSPTPSPVASTPAYLSETLVSPGLVRFRRIGR